MPCAVCVNAPPKPRLTADSEVPASVMVISPELISVLLTAGKKIFPSIVPVLVMALPDEPNDSSE